MDGAPALPCNCSASADDSAVIGARPDVWAGSRMTYLVAGLVALIFALLLGRWMASAQPAVVARGLRWALRVIVAMALIFIVWAGRYQFIAIVMPFLIPALLRWRSGKGWRDSARGPRPGQQSTIATAFLRMSLDHDSGNLDGEVIAGGHAGRRLGDMPLDALMGLRDECRRDEASLRILEAYLDRVHGAAWRADTARGEPGTGAAPPAGQAMTRDEAYAILGLAPGADDQMVKSAHRHLMTRLHPDHGGSDHLAALINRARDLLLGRS